MPPVPHTACAVRVNNFLTVQPSGLVQFSGNTGNMADDPNPWSASEDEVLIRSLAARASIENTAKFLSRTVQDCRARLEELDARMSRDEEPRQ